MADILAGVSDAVISFQSRNPVSSAVVVADEYGEPVPASGYDWNDPTCPIPVLSGGVRWVPGSAHRGCAHIIAEDEEGWWRPEPGYVWLDALDSDKMRKNVSAGVIWKPGMVHRDQPHVIADTYGWLPEVGYEWRDASTLERRLKWGVVWRSGVLAIRDGKRVISGREEGTWGRASERSRDEILAAFSDLSNFNYCKYLYIGSNIPSMKAHNARISMRVPRNEDIVVLYDDTVWGGSREGFVVTNKGVYAKALFEDRVHFAWDKISSISIISRGLCINDRTFFSFINLNGIVAPKLSQAFQNLL